MAASYGIRRPSPKGMHWNVNSICGNITSGEIPLEKTLGQFATDKWQKKPAGCSNRMWQSVLWSAVLLVHVNNGSPLLRLSGVGLDGREFQPNDPEMKWQLSAQRRWSRDEAEFYLFTLTSNWDYRMNTELTAVFFIPLSTKWLKLLVDIEGVAVVSYWGCHGV